MFEVGKSYSIETSEGRETVYSRCTILQWEPPLLKLKPDTGREFILNTSSLTFVKATPVIQYDVLDQVGRGDFT